MDKGQAVRRRVLRQLGEQGWHRVAVASLATLGSPEVWTLESLWTPRGLRAHLLFVTSSFNRATVHFSGPLPDTDWVPRQEYEEWPSLRSLPLESAPIFEELIHWRETNAAAQDDAETASLDPERLLQRLRGQLSDRKLRLFTCACLRHLRHIIEDERNLAAIETAEQYADGLIAKRDMKKARKASPLRWMTSFEPYPEAMSLIEAARSWTTAEQWYGLGELLGDVAGHPWHPVTLRPSWLRRNSGVVARMAQTIYEDRTFGYLPVLADALEEAGCENPLILHHCRQPGEHVRGCWVIDLLLGKQ